MLEFKLKVIVHQYIVLDLFNYIVMNTWFITASLFHNYVKKNRLSYGSP